MPAGNIFCRLVVLLLLSWSFCQPGIGASAAQGSKASLMPVRLKEFVDNGTIAGAVTLAAGKDSAPRVDAIGYADLAKREPMRTNSMFWIASMTKPITATAIFILRDEDKLAIDDQVIFTFSTKPFCKTEKLIAENC